MAKSLPIPELLHGPYRSPRVKPGRRLFCEIRGTVVVGKFSEGRIPWPMTKRPKGQRGGIAYIVCGDLVAALRRESSVAIQHWWGVSGTKVSQWRAELGVPAYNEGTKRRLQQVTPIKFPVVRLSPEKLKARREKLGIAVKALAQSLGCKVDEYRAYESGGKPPSRRRAERIAQILEQRVEDLMAKGARPESAPRSGTAKGRPVPEFLHGPYRPPSVKIGGRLFCEIHGEAVVGKFSDGRISWPLSKPPKGRIGGGNAHIVCGDLAAALRTESSIAIQHWWGVSVATVGRWRAALGVPAINQGTQRRLRQTKTNAFQGAHFSPTKLRARREELGMTEEALAHRLGCDACYYRTYESGAHAPWRQRAKRIAKVLECNLEDLLAPGPPPWGDSPGGTANDLSVPELLHGPYRPPSVEPDAPLLCEVRGEVVVKGFSGGRIPWPVAKRSKGERGGGCPYVVCGDLAAALRRESASAIHHWWGVSLNTVTRWRKLLGVPELNEGTRRIRKPYHRVVRLSPAKLKARREMLGLSPGAVADRMGCFRGNYHPYERARNPKPPMAKRIAEALECEVEDLLA